MSDGPRLISDFTTACKIVGKHFGYTGRSGGWIYDSSGNRICQGWTTLASRKMWMKNGTIVWDSETKKHIINLPH